MFRVGWGSPETDTYRRRLRVKEGFPPSKCLHCPWLPVLQNQASHRSAGQLLADRSSSHGCLTWTIRCARSVRRSPSKAELSLAKTLYRGWWLEPKRQTPQPLPTACTAPVLSTRFGKTWSERYPLSKACRETTFYRD